VLPDKAVEDAKSAMRWVRANATRLGIDPNRIVSCGGSSGGHLAASIGVLEEFDAPGDDVRFSAKPNAMMLHFPLLDFLAGGTRTMPFLDALDGDKVLGERLSPARHWRNDLPPTLVLIGTKDPMFEFLKGFAAKWKDAGADLALYIGEGGGHGFSTTATWRERSLARMEEFLRHAGCFEAKPAMQLGTSAAEAAPVIRKDAAANEPAWIVNGNNKLPKIQRVLGTTDNVRAVFRDTSGRQLAEVRDLFHQHTDVNKLVPAGDVRIEFYDQEGKLILQTSDLKDAVKIKETK